jgi:hypothetical protein
MIIGMNDVHDVSKIWQLSIERLPIFRTILFTVQDGTKRPVSNVLHDPDVSQVSICFTINLKMASTKNSSRIDLENFLNDLQLHVKPAIHVNGKDHPTALVVVDFGAPLQQVKLSTEQSQDLTAKLRKFARDVAVKDANIRISSDNYLGLVFWASSTH